MALHCAGSWQKCCSDRKTCQKVEMRKGLAVAAWQPRQDGLAGRCLLAGDILQDVLELHTQFTLQQFATWVAWQAVNKYHTAGRLEMGQPAAAEVDDLLFGQGLALSDD